MLTNRAHIMKQREGEEIRGPAEDYDAWYASHPEIFESELRAINSLELRGLGLDIGAGTGVITAAVGEQVALDLRSRC